jgi:RES domain-containing protein
VNTLPITARSGTYSRVCKPDWVDCADSSFAKAHGGRWNPPGEFGALYLNQTRSVAAANAREQHAGRAIGLFDLRPERRPDLAEFSVPDLTVVDAVSPDGIAGLALPAEYPIGVGWAPCQFIARAAYGASLAGIASRSAAEARVTGVVGEELAVFDTHALVPIGRLPFAQWYPDPAPPDPGADYAERKLRDR